MLLQAYAVVLNADGTFNSSTNFANQAFLPPGSATASYIQLLTQFRSLGIEAHRLAFYGVTAYQDGPTLADQGTLTAAQWHVARRKYYISANPAGSANAMGVRRVVTYQPSDFANYSTSQYMPNAYFGQSKEGVYLPLRLSGNQSYVTDADLELVDYNFGRQDDDDVIDIHASAVGAAAPPYPLATGVWANLTPVISIVGDPVYKPLNQIFGGISARNLAPTTSFSFYFRVGIEARVSPASMLASQVRMSPPVDMSALNAYSLINRELKDAYPSDFNDLGKLWEVIKSAARAVLPIIGAFGGPIGAGISGVGSLLLGMPDRKPTKSLPKTPSRQTQLPAASVDRLRDDQAVERSKMAHVGGKVFKPLPRPPSRVVKTPRTK